jgi:hypothetical protein
MSGISSRALLGAWCIALLPGCATTFKEHHYYQSVTPEGKVSNFYRLTVSGYAAMSSARYISGYYDERAVDIYFDELKIKQTNETEPLKTIFRADLKDPGSQDVIKPLSPSKEHGTFVMILSTNAASVSQTIGQFSENQVVADAITNLANRDTLLRASGASVVRSAGANATADELARLMGQLPSSATPGAAETETALIRVANSLAGGLGGRPIEFKTLADAAAWFAQSTAEITP